MKRVYKTRYRALKDSTRSRYYCARWNRCFGTLYMKAVKQHCEQAGTTLKDLMNKELWEAQ